MNKSSAGKRRPRKQGRRRRFSGAGRMGYHGGMRRTVVMLLVLFSAACPLRAAPMEVLSSGVFHVGHAPEDAAHARIALEVLEKAAAELAGRLPTGLEPIRVLLPPTAAEFHRHATRFQPGQVTGLAKPSEGFIAVKLPTIRGGGGDNFAGTLRHELVHVLLERNVNTAHLPNWLNEGLAMMLAREYQMATPITIAQMYLQGRIIPYRNLDWAFMNPGEEQEFSDAYAQALSMTRYLQRRLGEEGFWQLVLAMREMSFSEALRRHAGMSVSDLWDGYHRSLWHIALIGTLASGSFFTPAAFLVIIAWMRKRKRDRATLDQWAVEEAAARRGGPDPVVSWEEVLDDETVYLPGIDDEEDEY